MLAVNRKENIFKTSIKKENRSSDGIILKKKRN